MIILIIICIMYSVEANGSEITTEVLQQEKLNQIKPFLVKEDIIDQLVGNFTAIWGAEWGKQVVLHDQKCFHDVRVKRNGKRTLLTPHGAPVIYNVEFVEQGIYRLEALLSNGIRLVTQVCILYSKNNVIVHSSCVLGVTRLPALTTVEVRTDTLLSPLTSSTKNSIDEAVKIVKDHPELFLGIVPYPECSTGYYKKLNK